jgi:hypothetical protein
MKAEMRSLSRSELSCISAASARDGSWQGFSPKEEMSFDLHSTFAKLSFHCVSKQEHMEAFDGLEN